MSTGNYVVEIKKGKTVVARACVKTIREAKFVKKRIGLVGGARKSIIKKKCKMFTNIR